MSVAAVERYRPVEVHESIVWSTDTRRDSRIRRCSTSSPLTRGRAHSSFLAAELYRLPPRIGVTATTGASDCNTAARRPDREDGLDLTKGFEGNQKKLMMASQMRRLRVDPRRSARVPFGARNRNSRRTRLTLPRPNILEVRAIHRRQNAPCARDRAHRQYAGRSKARQM